MEAVVVHVTPPPTAAASSLLPLTLSCAASDIYQHRTVL